jgi:hypothetical protein
MPEDEEEARNFGRQTRQGRAGLVGWHRLAYSPRRGRPRPGGDSGEVTRRDAVSSDALPVMPPERTDRVHRRLVPRIDGMGPYLLDTARTNTML